MGTFLSRHSPRHKEKELRDQVFVTDPRRNITRTCRYCTRSSDFYIYDSFTQNSSIPTCRLHAKQANRHWNRGEQNNANSQRQQQEHHYEHAIITADDQKPKDNTFICLIHHKQYVCPICNRNNIKHK